MDRTSNASFPSYFISGTLALFLSWVMAGTLTGCRLGNYVERSPSTDTMEFFQSKPKSMNVCAYVQGPSDVDVVETCVTKGMGFPTGLTNIFSHPVAMYTEQASPGLALFFNPEDPAKQIVVELDQSENVSYNESSSGSEIFWMSPCTRKDYLQVAGAVNRTTEIKGSTFDGYTLSGQLDIQVASIIDVGNECTDALADLAGCYQSAETCNAETAEEKAYWHEQARSFLAFWTNNGALVESDIPYLKTLAYEVKFE